MTSLLEVHTESDDSKPPGEEETHPTFGPRPNTTSKEFYFQSKIKGMVFKLNWGENVHLMPFKQAHFIDTMYNTKEVFSLHDEDLGYCNWITHTIPMMRDVSVYFPKHTIPHPLPGEVWHCLGTWLRQGIIRPSNCPYASQWLLYVKIWRSISMYQLRKIKSHYHSWSFTTTRNRWSFRGSP